MTVPPVHRSFLRRAVEMADLDAVRVALYQHTGDPRLAALPLAREQDAGQREALVTAAVDWLEQHAGPGAVAEPPDQELRALMTMAAGKPMGDLEFAARRDLPAFRPFPYAAAWTEDRPAAADGFTVAIVGSGFSGLAMAVQLSLLGIEYVVLEREPEAGGTWTINRYPDVRVDTSSITYEFSFEKEYRWSEHFARGQEVRAYLQHISEKYGVHDRTRFGHTLERAAFDERRNLWHLEASTPNGTVSLEVNAVVNALGTFTNPRLIRFEGQELFTGPIVHPARWPADLDLAGKRVAIIGNGSTGVQMTAPIAEEAAQLYVFQRTPQWISPRAKYGQPVEPEIRWLLDNFPGYWHWARYTAAVGLFESHEYLVPDPAWKAKGGHVNAVNDQLRADLIAYIERETGGRADLVDRLVPDYAPFSRRPVVDNGWYRALTRDHVELVTDPIARLTPTGIETTDGRAREVDVIVTATGFDVARYLWPATYLGRGGLDVQDLWAADGARAYLGMLVPHFPNMFVLYGPNAQPVSGGTGLPMWYAIWSGYVGRCLVRMLEEGRSTVEVTREAFDRYNKELDAEAAQLLLLAEEGAPDKNYYVNEFGRLQVNAPWYGPEFHRMCTEVAWEDLRLS